jgi:hypothetical protein
MCALRVSIVKEKGPGRFLIATRAATQLSLGTVITPAPKWLSTSITNGRVTSWSQIC